MVLTKVEKGKNVGMPRLEVASNAALALYSEKKAEEV
jgi:hypothetical protein